MPGECSVECGGGELTMTRQVVTPASNGGAECPIMIEKEVSCFALVDFMCRGQLCCDLKWKRLH